MMFDIVQNLWFSIFFLPAALIPIERRSKHSELCFNIRAVMFEFGSLFGFLVVN